MMLDRHQLEAFATVVETLSFERAAEKLNVTRGAISQRIKALEEALSAVVLVRDKPLALTSVGEVLFKHVAAVRLLEADTFGQIRPHGVSGRGAMPLAIGVDAHSIDTWFCAVVRRLIERNTVELEVVVDDADPGFPALTRGEIIGCVSTVPRPARGCVATPIGDIAYRCVASPEFIQRHFAKGFCLHSATSAPAVLLGRRTALLDRYLDAVFGVSVGRYRKNFLPSPASQLEAIIAGVGYGLLPEQTVLSRLASGELVDVLRHMSFPVTLYWHHWRAAPPICESISSEIIACGREILQVPQTQQSMPGSAQHCIAWPG
ncbi:chromosome replication initiation inhibitor protein [Caballeronia arationis]|jgi:LysR family transcriptional regulator (chromosome initiation inhibitor)|uniref:Transcriptional regulator, ArgP family n=1 Tax=Caballeronia arationis TaxID=1777142 RepID=A0A7Z7I384_9BURK|nr:HTH-type transcriptional regulator ArgP [Caballeronia arationis]SAK91985.1 chromosome replication initiation inhibitor protein [Caballeronia arationis]SOE55234.1 transcriptional regulator, ArgP family [Caballeronia arationis]